MMHTKSTHYFECQFDSLSADVITATIDIWAEMPQASQEGWSVRQFGRDIVAVRLSLPGWVLDPRPAVAERAGVPDVAGRTGE